MALCVLEWFSTIVSWLFYLLQPPTFAVYWLMIKIKLQSQLFWLPKCSEFNPASTILASRHQSKVWQNPDVVMFLARCLLLPFFFGGWFVVVCCCRCLLFVVVCCIKPALGLAHFDGHRLLFGALLGLRLALAERPVAAGELAAGHPVPAAARQKWHVDGLKVQIRN